MSNYLKKKFDFKMKKLSKSQTSMASTPYDPVGEYESYTDGSSLTRINVLTSSAMVRGIQRPEAGIYSTVLMSRETLFVNVELYSRQLRSGNVLIFTLVVLLDPESGNQEFDRPPKQGLQNIGKHLIVLKTRNEIVSISLPKYSFPQTVKTTETTGTPSIEKKISDDILWERKPLETEFSFVLVDVVKEDLKNIYFSGTLNISHGMSSLLCLEPSLFFGKDFEDSVDRRSHQIDFQWAYMPLKRNRKVRVEPEPRRMPIFPRQMKNLRRNEEVEATEAIEENFQTHSAGSILSPTRLPV